MGVLITHDSEYENSLRESNEWNEGGEDRTRTEQWGECYKLALRNAQRVQTPQPIGSGVQVLITAGNHKTAIGGLRLCSSAYIARERFQIYRV